MKTVTFDETTHAIVPIKMSVKQLAYVAECTKQFGSQGADRIESTYYFSVKSAPPYQSVEVNNGLREAAEQALEALRYHVAQTRPINRTEEAINALMQALAAPKGEELALLCN
jgi:hypothetical protein